MLGPRKTHFVRTQPAGARQHLAYYVLERRHPYHYPTPTRIAGTRIATRSAIRPVTRPAAAVKHQARDRMHRVAFVGLGRALAAVTFAGGIAFGRAWSTRASDGSREQLMAEQRSEEGA